MRTIEVSEVTKLVRQLCIDANYYLPADLRQAFVDGQNAEESPLGKTIFGEMIANCDLARENNVPVCQDTRMQSPRVFAAAISTVICACRWSVIRCAAKTPTTTHRVSCTPRSFRVTR